MTGFTGCERCERVVTKFCSECGTALVTDAKYCSTCGANVQIGPVASPNPDEQGWAINDWRWYRRRPIGIQWLSAIAVIATLLFAPQLLWGNDNGSNQIASSDEVAIPSPTQSPSPAPPTPTQAPTPSVLARPAWIVNTLPIGCHHNPSATAPIAMQPGIGTVQAVNQVITVRDGVWHQDAAQKC